MLYCLRIVGRWLRFERGFLIPVKSAFSLFELMNPSTFRENRRKEIYELQRMRKTKFSYHAKNENYAKTMPRIMLRRSPFFVMQPWGSSISSMMLLLLRHTIVVAKRRRGWPCSVLLFPNKGLFVAAAVTCSSRRKVGRSSSL